MVLNSDCEPQTEDKIDFVQMAINALLSGQMSPSVLNKTNRTTTDIRG
jgi:hypothetical protein